MKNNSKSKAQKVLEAIQDVDDPIRKEVIEKFGPIVGTFNTDEELRDYFKKLAEKRGHKWNR